VATFKRPSGWLALALVLGVQLLAAGQLGAQSSSASVPTYEYWPDLNVYYRINENFRLMAQGGEAIGTDGEPLSGNVGLNLDIAVKPHPFKTYVLGAPSLVEDRHRYLNLRLGYRYSETSQDVGKKVQNRLLTELTVRFNLFGLVASDRNGFDWRWTEGAYTTRYRNRLQFERPIQIGTYGINPYANAEIIYLLSSGEWNQIRYRAGIQFPVVDHVTLDPFVGLNHTWQPTANNLYGLGFKLIVSF
jgi:hypothetical protein